MASIYKITNLINSKVYIGKTINDPQLRWNSHKSESRKISGHGSNYPIHNAMRKYGIENFKFEVIEECEDERCFERETYYIKYYDSTDKTKGYNIVVEGKGGTRYSTEDILALWDKGFLPSEIASKIGASKYSTVTSRLKGNGITQKEILKRLGQNTRQRCSKPVLQYSLSGEFIKRWDSSTQCSMEGYLQSAVSAVCRQDQKSAYGSLWKYEDDQRDIQEWVDIAMNKRTSGKPKKKIEQLSVDKESIQVFESAAEAVRVLGLKDKSCLCRAAREHGKSHGYYWRYVDD